MKKKILIIILLVVTTLFLTYQQEIPHKLLGWYLSPSDNLISADAIVVVSGDDDRMKHAIDLYKKGLAPKLILSGAASDGLTSNALAMHLEASAAGIPNEVVLMEEKATNTYENALYTKQIVQNQEMDNIILVSSPYHQRRVYETFRMVFGGTDVMLQNSPSVYCSWKADNWWKSESELYLTQSEIGKILWASVTGNYKK